MNTNGITRRDNLNIATPERAFLDLIYLEPDTFFDHLGSLDKDKIFKLLPIYNVRMMAERVSKLFSDA